MPGLVGSVGGKVVANLCPGSAVGGVVEIESGLLIARSDAALVAEVELFALSDADARRGEFGGIPVGSFQSAVFNGGIIVVVQRPALRDGVEVDIHLCRVAYDALQVEGQRVHALGPNRETSALETVGVGGLRQFNGRLLTGLHSHFRSRQRVALAGRQLCVEGAHAHIGDGQRRLCVTFNESEVVGVARLHFFPVHADGEQWCRDGFCGGVGDVVDGSPRHVDGDELSFYA